ncbi:alpha/beta hydrolase [Mesorhizobium sp. M0488]|uniref:alpha/beta fold hydrolase n=1 Tax=unclassified Mesorhizobium TaxID=325217 RepID=UPI003338FD44
MLAFDRPGFGRSSRSQGRSWSAGEQADVIHDAVRNLCIEKYLVLGHSWGAWVAIELARRHAPSLAGIVLVSGYYPPPRLALCAGRTRGPAGDRHRFPPPLAAAACEASLALGDGEDLLSG